MNTISKKIRVNGKQLTCPICDGDHFRERKTLLNSRGATFFNFDWANEDAINYICADCGYILWFADYTRHQHEQGESIAKGNECPNCYSIVDSKDKECKNCGKKI